MFRSFSFFLLGGLLSVLSYAQPPASPTPYLESASALGQELFERSGATGMVLVVLHENQVFLEGYGQTAPGSGRRPDAHSVVRLCSLTKIFTSDLLTKLALDGTVRINDPLQKYAPTGVVVPSRQQPVTLLNLATHTAGLYREVGYPPDGTPHFTYPDYAMRWSWLAKQHLRATPGTVASYSNVGYDLLSDALAAAAHKPYASLLREKTLAPLHMWDTTFYPSPTQCKRLMTGSRDQSPCTVTANTEGSAGLYSTATDMARWLKYLVGAPGSPAQLRQAKEAYLQPEQLMRQSGLNYAGNPSAIGLGWIHLLDPGDPSHLIEKDGGGAGYLTYITIHPASHSALFVAMTTGRNGYHTNLFKASNNVLLTLIGAPPIPEAAGRPAARLLRAKAVALHPPPQNHKAAAKHPGSVSRRQRLAGPRRQQMTRQRAQARRRASATQMQNRTVQKRKPGAKTKKTP